jgi:hypothetical protein
LPASSQIHLLYIPIFTMDNMNASQISRVSQDEAPLAGPGLVACTDKAIVEVGEIGTLSDSVRVVQDGAPDPMAHAEVDEIKVVDPAPADHEVETASQQIKKDPDEGEIILGASVQAAEEEMKEEDVIAADAVIGANAVIFNGLSKVRINWKSSKRLAGEPEKHNGKDVSFAAYMMADMGTSEIACMLNLPCMLDVNRCDDETPNVAVEALFVICNKRGCVFVIFDGNDDSYSFIKPKEIRGMLGFLPSRKALARARIGDAILAFEAGKSAPKKKKIAVAAVAPKRVRDWQSALVDFCSGMLADDASDAQKMKLATLRECFLPENTRPTKAAKK